jgi:hypothetical protein
MIVGWRKEGRKESEMSEKFNVQLAIINDCININRSEKDMILFEIIDAQVISLRLFGSCLWLLSPYVSTTYRLPISFGYEKISFFNPEIRRERKNSSFMPKCYWMIRSWIWMTDEGKCYLVSVYSWTNRLACCCVVISSAIILCILSLSLIRWNVLKSLCNSRMNVVWMRN